MRLDVAPGPVLDFLDCRCRSGLLDTIPPRVSMFFEGRAIIEA